TRRSSDLPRRADGRASCGQRPRGGPARARRGRGMSAGLVAGVVALLLANAFFVGAEFAVISARRSQIEPLAEAGSRAAKTVLWAMENVSLMLATSQLGITICSVSLGVVAEPAIAHSLEGPFHSWGLSEAWAHGVAVA